MRIVDRLLAPRHQVHAHCDLFCGVYDPAQAMIEAKSCLNSATKYQDSDDEVFRARCISIKEERAEGRSPRKHYSRKRKTSSGRMKR